METIVPGLHASKSKPLGFGPQLEIRAFLLQRGDGNILIYRSAGLRDDVEAVTGFGGISHQYLNHWHEASEESDWVTDTFGAPLPRGRRTDGVRR